VFELQRLRLDHEAAVLAFEETNRAYFAGSISDRGDDFFRNFAEGYRASLDEQDAGRVFLHVLLDEDGTVLGRFNLYDVADRTAEAGYRVAKQASGRGVATAGLRDLCRRAGEEYGLRTLRARTSNQNVASQRVLGKAGFVATGSAQIEGRQGTTYELALTSSSPIDGA
jgi:[ribosomal protein S5]-alanine N-acetyltransferase